jgi:hypothetical protein
MFTLKRRSLSLVYDEPEDLPIATGRLRRSRRRGEPRSSSTPRVPFANGGRAGRVGSPRLCGARPSPPQSPARKDWHRTPNEQYELMLLVGAGTGHKERTYRSPAQE